MRRVSGPLIHADADAFFVSVALRGRPDLAGRPVVVGDPVVACASYPARAAGVRSGTGITEALRTCPSLVVLPVPGEEVEQVSDELFRILDRAAPAVEPGSMEEAFLDTSALGWAEVEEQARALRREVRERLGITVTTGIGRTKLFAKLASRTAKPDGLRVIGPEEERRLRTTLPLADVWGVGARTLGRLHALGVSTLGELAGVPVHRLHELCGTTMARRLRQVVEGCDDAEVRPVRSRQTLSAGTATVGWGRADRSPAELADVVCRRLAHRAGEAGLVAGTVTVSLAREGVPTEHRRARLDSASAEEDLLRRCVAELLAAGAVPLVDTLTVTLSDLSATDRPRQDPLF
ncbi:DNA polymerase IV [Desertihabitans brevis]|uniref:DNA polymerase IV n=1 Tax=Desertihabitans brevis TaxID=2268447 RepID=A0A367YVK5_9ACTN|nr:DNA polymerase IV [Desertihabitans brevis]